MPFFLNARTEAKMTPLQKPLQLLLAMCLATQAVIRLSRELPGIHFGADFVGLWNAAHRVRQSFGQRILGVGDLMLESAGESGGMAIMNLDSPREIADQILAGSKRSHNFRSQDEAPHGSLG